MHLQVLARELESTKDLTISSALSFGGVFDAPITLGQASIDVVNSSPEYLVVEAAWKEAKRDCTERFGSVAAARRAKATSSLQRDYICADNKKHAR
ncbi:uncharacterized protein BP5553_01391 [Venustampulla echinocandica]|uniref:Uncharacterized protein n=1 Tax=Venustampulla echinocandica TaxID=2656787 RepID=A0A370U0W3_9HELO|nr:uncharacterized protein BP5553_01391 [Venustampulla echinocandica]RDL41412.1 hypothetical protein BP5553_01391 [Venustampulla echinocandica]